MDQTWENETRRDTLVINDSTGVTTMGATAASCFFIQPISISTFDTFSVQPLATCGSSAVSVQPRLLMITGREVVEGPCGATFCKAHLVTIEVNGHWSGTVHLEKRDGLSVDSASVVVPPDDYTRIALIVSVRTESVDAGEYALSVDLLNSAGWLVLRASETARVVARSLNHTILDPVIAQTIDGWLVSGVGVVPAGAAQSLCFSILPSDLTQHHSRISHTADLNRPVAIKPTHVGVGPTCEAVVLRPVREATANDQEQGGNELDG